MKRIIITFVLSIMLFPLTVNAQSQLRGDVNGDQNVTVSDVSFLVECILSGNIETNFNTCDINKDGEISILDVMTIVSIILNGDDQPDLIVSIESAVVSPNGSVTIDIVSGSGQYEVSSSNPDVVEAVLDGSKVIITSKVGGTIEIEGSDNQTPARNARSAKIAMTAHHAIITVTDLATNQTTNINVTVTDDSTPSLNCPDDNHPHVVDLGLPNGTKWACCNVDATCPEDKGGFYAWGETKTKSRYNWSNYEQAYRVEEDWEWACEDIGESISGTEFDVAHVKWGDLWHMPTLDDFNDLVENCSHVTTIINGMKGMMFTATNGASIFLPFAGIGKGSYTRGNELGDYWMDHQVPEADEFNTICNAFAIYENNKTDVVEVQKYNGYSVRPSYGNDFKLSISFSKEGLDMVIGESIAIEINSGSGNYEINSSAPNVITATLSGTTITLLGMSEGTTEFSVTDKTSLITKRTKVTVRPLCPDNNHPHFIGMGLPSATKWACCNVDTNNPNNQAPTNFGGYYAWGEIEENAKWYNWNTYIHCDGTSETCHDLGNCISGTQFDVAYMNWGEEWQMPTKDQMDELCRNTNKTNTTINGVRGIKFTSKNGSIIFLPATGGKSDYYTYQVGRQLEYWSGTLDPNKNSLAYILYNLTSTNNYCYVTTFNGSRDTGHSVRPVRAVSSNTITLSCYSMQLNLTDFADIEIISGEGSYSISNSNPAVVAATLSGTTISIKAKAAGEAEVTVKDVLSGATEIVKVKVTNEMAIFTTCPDDNHPHKIDLDLPSGLKWACCNIDANQPTEYGGCYAWGETMVKDSYTWSSYIYYDGNTDACQDIGNSISGKPQYDVARHKWGGKWQIPSINQFGELIGNCQYKWTTLHGVWGGMFTGSNGQSIFLPAAFGNEAFYQTGTLHYGDYSFGMAFGKNRDIATDWSLPRYMGQSVRAIVE